MGAPSDGAPEGHARRVVGSNVPPSICLLIIPPSRKSLTETFSSSPRCPNKSGIWASIHIGPILIEQRRVGDEYRSTEKMLQLFEARLATRGLEAADRAQIETAIANTRTELERLWNRMLELDAAVTASAFKSGEP